MSVSKKHQEYANEYVKEKYDRVSLILKPKGKKEQVQAHAKKRGESVNSFIARAIDETMERDNAEEDSKTP
ncbi:MAG: hypothetical protein LUD78_04655 [Clostridiales bacterium]|nr:hypothetical protein [Clostridiales bacterium]